MAFNRSTEREDRYGVYIYWPCRHYHCNSFSMRAIYRSICHPTWKSIFNYLFSFASSPSMYIFYRLIIFFPYIFVACYYSTSMIYDNGCFFCMESASFFFKIRWLREYILFVPFHVYFPLIFLYSFFHTHTKNKNKIF